MPFIEFHQENNLMDLAAESCFRFVIQSSIINVTIKPLDEQVKQLYISVKIQNTPSSVSASEQTNKKSPNHQDLTLEIKNQDFQREKFNCPKQLIEYSQVFDIWDLINFKNQKHFAEHHSSLFWFKIYLQSCFQSISHLCNSKNQPSDLKHKILNETFNFTNKLHMKKLIRNQKLVCKILESIKTQNLPATDKSQNTSQYTQKFNISTKSNVQINKISQNKSFLFVKIDPNQLNCQNSLFRSSFLLNLPQKCIPNQKIISKSDIEFVLKEQRDKQIQDIFFDQRPNF